MPSLPRWSAPPPANSDARDHRGQARLRLALRGAVPVSTALVLQWALHVADPSVPFAPFSLGERVIRSTPGGLATAAIDNLGHLARPLLSLSIVAGAVALGMLVSRYRAIVGAGLLAGVSAVASLLDPSQPAAVYIAMSALIAGLGAWATAELLSPSRLPEPRGTTPRPASVRRLGRRRFLFGLGLALGSLLLFGAALRRVLEFAGVEPVRADRPAVVPSDAGFAEVAGLSPKVTSRADHYVVDVNLDPPVVSASDWRLRVHGSVDHTLALSLDDLRAMPTVEQLSTLSCISNPVGGSLVGNSLWTGVPLRTVLSRAGVRPSATTLRAVGAEGYRDTIPLELATRPDVLVAIGMDGATLPVSHGFPARLLIPGLYGMKNVKWLTDLVLLDRPEEGYWEERGWDLQAVVRTESRFDTPADGAAVPARFTAAGIAWAGTRQISKVEVSADDGASWREAKLETMLSPLSWRRWEATFDLAPGTHPLMVRAHDGSGAVQDAERRPPHPAGASGHHRIVVTVRD